MAEFTINLPSLSGSKTYLCAVGMGILTIANALGYVPNPWYEMGMGVLGGGGLAALRAGVVKSGPGPVVDQVANMVATAIQMQPPCAKIPDSTGQPPAG